ncbi:uncharacterized protein LTR77_010948 [Saxophila tyrrhenica]|uniref:NAD(P)-binding domain-containing protein n=1 Tax=Saxophila tyrrhenica TaxID=1690608 RepID=A0AAV9NU56_9PEZI|nr:hypothetical protein LTR77_010948 [Saxophila tyrrhenica]
MRVLLLGATGNVGSRLLPSLVAHGHSVIVYVRNPSKLPSPASACASAVVTGSATDSAAVESAILSHECDAVINAAGVAPVWGESGELPTIFAAVADAVEKVQERRGGAPLRVWFLSGFGILDHPAGRMMIDYIPVYTIHRHNFARIRDVPKQKLAWSLFCASTMTPRSEAVDYTPKPGAGAEQLVAKVESPPAWSRTLLWIPLLGKYFNVMAQAAGYAAPLEDCVDFIAGDLQAGLESQYVGHRVAVKVKSKSS